MTQNLSGCLEKKHLILKRKLYGFSSVIVLHSTGFASAFNQNGTAMQSILKVFYELLFFFKDNQKLCWLEKRKKPSEYYITQ